MSNCNAPSTGPYGSFHDVRCTNEEHHNDDHSAAIDNGRRISWPLTSEEIAERCASTEASLVEVLTAKVAKLESERDFYVKNVERYEQINTGDASLIDSQQMIDDLKESLAEATTKLGVALDDQLAARHAHAAAEERAILAEQKLVAAEARANVAEAIRVLATAVRSTKRPTKKPTRRKGKR